MALSKDVYRELEDIVGTENLSDDPAALETYSFQGTMITRVSGKGASERFVESPEAVVLPGSAKEVQAVLKLCNRRGVYSKAIGTGYGGMGTVQRNGVIVLDLRRMNRILEIDEKNMNVVVEPYVSFAQVQAEVMKRGLNTHIIGAGAQCSFLASHTSLAGTNTQAISYGWGGRNLLGVEWVLPTGEIVRLGSIGSGAGWFSGDGPGPSLRGIMRGVMGARGGLGVFTKCASHLHPWSGPPVLEIKGISPDYETVVPPLFEYRIIEWPDWDKCAEAQYRIGKAGIAFAMHKTGGPGSHGASVTGSNNEYYEKWDDLKDIPWASYVVVTMGNSREEHAYQLKVLDKITEDTGGKIYPLGEKPIMKNRDFINMVKGCFIPRTAFRLTGTFACPLSGADTIQHAAMGLSLDKDFRKKYDERGILADDAVNEMWGVPFDGGHWAIFECGHFYDPSDDYSSQGAQEMLQEAKEMELRIPLGPFLQGTGNVGAREYGPLRQNYHNWMLKIKKTFDLNTVSEPDNYISAD